MGTQFLSKAGYIILGWVSFDKQNKIFLKEKSQSVNWILFLVFLSMFLLQKTYIFGEKTDRELLKTCKNYINYQ